MRWWFWNVMLALDQLANALLFGHADETLSARAYRVRQGGKFWGLITCPLIDLLFFIITLGRDRHHCRNAFLSELARRHLPREYEQLASEKAKSY